MALAQFRKTVLHGWPLCRWRKALLSAAVLAVLSGCMGAHEVRPVANTSSGEVSRVDAELRQRILTCALGYMSRQGSVYAEIGYSSDATALHVRTTDSGLRRHLDSCVGQVPTLPVAGQVVIGSGLPEVSDVRR